MSFKSKIILGVSFFYLTSSFVYLYTITTQVQDKPWKIVLQDNIPLYSFAMLLFVILLFITNKEIK